MAEIVIVTGDWLSPKALKVRCLITMMLIAPDNDGVPTALWQWYSEDGDWVRKSPWPS